MRSGAATDAPGTSGTGAVSALLSHAASAAR